MKMNKRKFAHIASIMLLGLTFLLTFMAGQATASGDKPWTISISTFDSAKGANAPAFKAIKADLEKATNGKVTAKIYYSQALGKAKEQYELAIKGVADISCVLAGYTPGRFPISDLPSFAVSPSGAVSAAAMAKIVEMGYLDKEYGKVKIISVTGTAPSHVLWRKGIKAVTLEEFKGKKIRVPTTGAANLLKALGASPVGMPIPEVYTSLERGVIDGVLTMVNVYDAFGISNVSNEITRLGMPAMSFSLVMNMRTWKKLPPEAKAVLEKNRGKYAVITGKTTDRLNEFSINKHKPKFYDSSPEVKKIALEALSKELKGYIQKYEKHGFPIMKAAKLYHQTVKEMAGVEPFILP
ncbi:MAG: TRAP transporter substrate-binding protein DctP [Desulfatiglandales bacterium]|jgi:TRAP-type C4-dicarboxylate transport system substrate-binding protein|nr:TRAP transporter substrate-binding protein DctP [Desulfatiglandales bacterium]